MSVMKNNSSFSVLILAAGKATRFKSDRSKLLHRLAGLPLGEYALRTALSLAPDRTYLVVGHQADAIRRAFDRPGLIFIEQKEQLGTGHALMVARPELENCPSQTLLVMAGDAPLLTADTLRGLIKAHIETRAAATVLTAVVDDPRGYGRIVRVGGRSRDPRIRAIIEEKIANASQKNIREVNSAIICFNIPKLLARLGELTDQNAQKEYLLTDLAAIFNRHREKVIAFRVEDAGEVLGVNDRVELAQMEAILRRRKAESLMRAGVTVVHPDITYIDETVEVGPDTVIEPGASLLGTTSVGRGCRVGCYSTIANSQIGDRVEIRQSVVVSDSTVASGSALGPFAHLRDNAVLLEGARIGNFVEVKKSKVGRGTKAQHLTYLGDATLGDKVNIGAGTVTCNYDGEKKYPTVMEDGVFIGSGTMLVAPVRVGKGAYVAAGSTITQDVPPESLGIGRALQVNKEGWVTKKKGEGK